MKFKEDLTSYDPKISQPCASAFDLGETRKGRAKRRREKAEGRRGVCRCREGGAASAGERRVLAVVGCCHRFAVGDDNKLFNCNVTYPPVAVVPLFPAWPASQNSTGVCESS